MTKVTSGTSFTLPKGKSVEFSLSSGKGSASVDGSSYVIGTREAFIGPYGTDKTIRIHIEHGEIDYSIDDNGDFGFDAPSDYAQVKRDASGNVTGMVTADGGNPLALQDGKIRASTSLGAVVFIFDDGYLNAKTTVAPLFEARGIRAGFAIPFTDVDGKDASKFMSLSDCVALQDAGHEIGSHTYSNTALTSSSVADETAKFEIRGGAEMLAMAGIDAKFFVSVNSTLASGFKQHLHSDYSHAFTVYKGGSYAADALQTTIESDPFGMHRTSLFTLWEATNATEGLRTIDRIKETIDYVINNGGLVVFYDHDPSRVYVPDSLPESVLTEVLDYVVSSGVTVLTPSEAFDTFSPTTIKGQKVDLVAARARRMFAGADNLLTDSQMTDYSDTTSTSWYLDKTLIGTGGATLSPFGTGTTKPLVLSLDSAFTPGDEVVLRNRTYSVGADGTRVGALCYSVWLQSGSSGRDTNWEVRVGIRVINQSTLAELAKFESGVCSLRDLFRRFHAVAAAVPSYSVAFTAEVYLRFISKAAGSMSCRIKHPMLHQGIYPQAFKHGA